jgi:hypothetical protein
VENITFLAQSLTVSSAGYAVRILVGGIVVMACLLLIASATHNRFQFTKKSHFTGIAAVSISVIVALLLVHLALLSSSSESGIERRVARLSLVACDQQIPLNFGSNLSDFGGDGRHKIYNGGQLEFLGYRTNDREDVSLNSFFRSVGGGISANILTLPFTKSTESDLANSLTLKQFIRTNPVGGQYLELVSGNACNVTPSMVSVFVYSYDEASKYYEVQRLAAPDTYIISSATKKYQDCIVVIYGNPTTQTNLRCGDYPLADQIKIKALGAGQ